MEVTAWDSKIADMLRLFSTFASVILPKADLSPREVARLAVLDDAGLIKTEETTNPGLRITLTEEGKRALWHWDQAHPRN